MAPFKGSCAGTIWNATEPLPTSSQGLPVAVAHWAARSHAAWTFHWRFPEMRYPQVTHLYMEFPYVSIVNFINQPAIGDPPFMES